jgi:uncharacterized protein
MLVAKRLTLIFFIYNCFGCTQVVRLQENTVDDSSAVLKKKSISDTSVRFPQKGKLAVHHKGRTLFEAHTKRGKLNGTWQSWYGNGNLCDSGRFENNIPTGLWKFWNIQGQLVYIREYNADKYNKIKTQFIRYNHKGVAYYLSFLYSKNKKEAQQYLHSKYSFPNSIERQYKSLQAQVAANTSGLAYQPIFYSCLHDGLFVNYAATGIAVDSGYYKDGLKTGNWIHKDLSENKIYQGRYEHGKQIKDWKVYSLEYRLQEVIHYNMAGHIVWRKQIQVRR